MEYVIIAFRSRAHTIEFANFIKRNGVAMEIVNTPKEAGVGCGLSVKVKKQSYNFCKNAVIRLSLSSFAGFFLITSFGKEQRVRRI